MPTSSESNYTVRRQGDPTYTVRPGVMLVVASLSVPMEHVMATLAQGFLSGANLGLPFPECPLIVCLSGHPRLQDSARRLFDQYMSLKRDTDLKFHSAEVRQDLDWTLPEAFQHLAEA